MVTNFKSTKEFLIKIYGERFVSELKESQIVFIGVAIITAGGEDTEESQEFLGNIRALSKDKIPELHPACFELCGKKILNLAELNPFPFKILNLLLANYSVDVIEDSIQYLKSFDMYSEAYILRILNGMHIKFGAINSTFLKELKSPTILRVQETAAFNGTMGRGTPAERIPSGMFRGNHDGEQGSVTEPRFLDVAPSIP